jgi:serine/threonine protein kinase
MTAQGRRYEILSVLGSGGFGTVYRAEQLSELGLRREVALKVLHAAGPESEEAARRLRDEARMLSNLHCAGIVRVEDLMVLDGRWTMVMELVPGVDVERLLVERGHLPARVALSILEKVATSLWAVNQAQGPEGEKLELVHRDVKPANLLVTADGDVKLLDFGVARAELAEREAHTQQAFVMGSLPYMAPERYSFQDLHAGDVYGLGCCLYEMLLGERFGRTRPKLDSHVDRVRKALHRAWDRLDADLQEPVLALLGEMLAYDPAVRPNAEQVAARALELRRRAEGPSLNQWAQGVVPAALAARDSVEPDALCGQVMTEATSIGEGGEEEDTTLEDLEEAEESQELTDALPPPFASQTPPPPPPLPARPKAAAPGEGPKADPRPSSASPAPPPHLPKTQVRPARAPKARSKVPLFLGGGVLVGVLLALTGGLLALAIRGAKRPAPVPETVTVEPERVDEEPMVDTGGIRFQDIDPLELENKPRRKRGGPKVLRGPGRDIADVPKAKVPMGSVSVTGDLESLRLVSGSETFGPGVVPAGSYTLFPSFPGGYTVKGPRLDLQEGQTARFHCSAASLDCERL